MVKANAYGLGVAQAVSTLEVDEPYAYGVATADEGLELRELGVSRPVIVMTPAPRDTLAAAVELELTTCVSSLEDLRGLATEAALQNRRASFHLEIDTGMGRAGFDWRGSDAWGGEVAALTGEALEWGGCYTHFHSADNSGASIDEQWSRFEDALGRLTLPPGALIHACNSAAAFRRPAYAASAVRPGIFLYGGVAGEGGPDPESVCTVRARITLVREVPAGTTLGYGATHTAAGVERWATVAIGYGDGLPRALGNRGHVLVGGRRAPIIGRISMDLTVVDISHVAGSQPGDVATFIGGDGDEQITVEEIAEHASTINYEILTGFTPRLPRIWQG